MSSEQLMALPIGVAVVTSYGNIAHVRIPQKVGDQLYSAQQVRDMVSHAVREALATPSPQADKARGEGITWPVRVLEMRKEGWTFQYEPATKFVGANHPMGGKLSVLSFNRHSYADQMGEAIAASMNAAHTQARPDGGGESCRGPGICELCSRAAGCCFKGERCGRADCPAPLPNSFRKPAPCPSARPQSHPAPADVARLVEAAAIVAAAQDGAFSSEWDELDKAIAPFTTDKQRGSDGESVPDVQVQGEGEGDVCPNCVTPWKCNGPHIGEAPDSGYETTTAQAQLCHMRGRCECIGACKYGLAGNGANPSACELGAVRAAIQKARNIADGASACNAQGPQHQAGMRRACNIIEAALQHRGDSRGGEG